MPFHAIIIDHFIYKNPVKNIIKIDLIREIYRLNFT